MLCDYQIGNYLPVEFVHFTDGIYIRTIEMSKYVWQAIDIKMMPQSTVSQEIMVGFIINHLKETMSAKLLVIFERFFIPTALRLSNIWCYPENVRGKIETKIRSSNLIYKFSVDFHFVLLNLTPWGKNQYKSTHSASFRKATVYLHIYFYKL